MSSPPVNVPLVNLNTATWPPSLGPTVTGSHASVRIAWNGKDPHPSMEEAFSSSSPQQLKELSVQRGIKVFTEYLAYDRNTPEKMKEFVHMYPWVLTEPLVCNAVAGNPCCYTALKEMDWWNTILANVNHPSGTTGLWLKQSNIQALAYHTSDKELTQMFDWPTWKRHLQDNGVIYMMSNDANVFSRTEAFIVLANRLDVAAAPLMCAAMRVLMPQSTFETVVEGKWSPLQKAQYAWLMGRTPVAEIVIATPIFMQGLRQAYCDIACWQQLVEPQELANLAIVYELNNANVEKTIADLIQLTQSASSTESLDYTQALDDSA